MKDRGKYLELSLFLLMSEALVEIVSQPQLQKRTHLFLRLRSFLFIFIERPRVEKLKQKSSL